MDGKTGWARTAIIERLYPLTGTFEKAKILFDKYYRKVLFYLISSFQPIRISFGGTIWNSWGFIHRRKWLLKVKKISKWSPILEPCCLNKNLMKSPRSMNNGWSMVQSKKKKKSSETSQPHSVTPSKIGSSHWLRIT